MGFSESTFMGPDGKKRTTRRSIGKRISANQVVTDKNIYFIFDLSGKKNVAVKIDSEVDFEGNKLLVVSSGNSILGKYSLPKKINIKDMNHTFKHGILEVSFRR
jgi:HSP20 family molecular chaperone IbpA